MIFSGGGVGWGWWWWSRSKEKSFNICFQCRWIDINVWSWFTVIGCQVFSPNSQKLTWEHLGGHQTPPVMPPITRGCQGCQMPPITPPPMLFYDNLVKKLDSGWSS